MSGGSRMTWGGSRSVQASPTFDVGIPGQVAAQLGLAARSKLQWLYDGLEGDDPPVTTVKPRGGSLSITVPVEVREAFDIGGDSELHMQYADGEERAEVFLSSSGLPVAEVRVVGDG